MEITERHALAAALLRREIPAVRTMILNVVGDTPLKREELFQEIKVRYKISLEVLNDVGMVELSSLVKEGVLVRPKHGYYKKAA